MTALRWTSAIFGALICAQFAAAEQSDRETELESLFVGEMAGLRASMRPVASAAFTDVDGTAVTLTDFAGKYVLVNFWAPWCAPCREEMPDLSLLQDEFGGASFEVVTIAVGQNHQVAIERFLNDIGADNLPRYADPLSRVSGETGILGLPATILVDPTGYEIARLQGAADWASVDALTLVTHLIAER